jgi:vacuolar-type H+-ATPase subunit C/Vma6
VRWDDVNARARGLATHLLRRADLLRAAAAGGWLAAARALLGRGYPADPTSAIASPDDFDREVGRVAARRLGILARWLAARRPALAVVYGDEERRSIRALLRGAVQGSAPEARLRGLLPTAGLSERALGLLSRADSPAGLVHALLRLGHPAGRALEAAAPHGSAASGGWLGLLRMEVALSRLFAARATRAARRGGRLVRRFAAALIDLENLWTLDGLGDWSADVAPADLFLPGGEIVSRARFVELASVPGPARRRAELKVALRRTAFARLFEPDNRLGSEGRALAAMIAWLRSEARREPLGPAVLLEVVERIRAEAHDVRAAVGGAQLAAPLGTIEALLVTAA